MKKKIIAFGALLTIAPAFAFAADAFSLITTLNKILSLLIPVLITAAVVYFIWGVIQYTVSSDEEKKKKARGSIIQGLIGLFVIVSFWGIIHAFSNTTGIGSDQLNQSAIPCIPGPGVSC